MEGYRPNVRRSLILYGTFAAFLVAVVAWFDMWWEALYILLFFSLPLVVVLAIVILVVRRAQRRRFTNRNAKTSEEG